MSLHRNGLPARIVDCLETDGGWLTSSYLAMVLDARPESVDRALYRLRGRGFVVSRRVELLAGVARVRPQGEGWAGFGGNEFGEPGVRGESRVEWRFTGWEDG